LSVAFSTRRFYDALLHAYAKAPIKMGTPDYSKVCFFLQRHHSVVIWSIRDKEYNIRVNILMKKKIKLETINNSHDILENM